ncbi:hypothetical protein [Sphingosinicella sp. BN140058]|uniref:hypothetical protein n=1 Tax=Sphingosinicella sp. BN140058 TaxID=1892855 RepID=UPI001011A7C7|nr:hypothetical protein [Sphingosinicella sp. BN140058]QAY77315.1 hypothetical protein ETR14_12985 [Sphingosinicella sp. BN140058]
MKRRAAALALIALGSGTAAAPTDQADSAESEIVIVAVKNPYRLSVKELRKALRAFRKGKPVYAPEATLLFQVKATGAKPLAGITLSLRRGADVIPLPLDPAGRFVLPDLSADDWTLVANRARAGLEVRPLVLSPGTAEGDRLLGDMRLQCLVGWAIEAQHVSIVARAAFNAAGGCFGSKFAIYGYSDRPIAAATVTSGQNVRPVQVLRDRHLYRAPLHDASLPNLARVRFRFD